MDGMASLTDVYEGHVRTVTTPRRRYAGASGFAAGTVMVVVGILVATTGLSEAAGLSVVAARRVAGVLAGLGLPLAFLGVFAVLPSGATARAAAVIGASVSAFGVALFGVAYPDQWFGAGDPLAVATVVVYFAGGVTTLSCLFAGLATFKTRNDPGGTARMEITEEGGVRVIRDAAGPAGGSTPSSSAGTVGLFGAGPDGDVRTQTNRDSPRSRDEAEDDAEILGGPGTTDRSHPAQQATADGGSAVEDDDFTGAEVLDTAPERGRPDVYCGNCVHFEYVKVKETITPYCGLHDELMENMDACTEWTETN